MARILVATRGDYLTTLLLRPLVEAQRHEIALLRVTGDDRGRTGARMLRALWRAGEPSAVGLEIAQVVFFRIAGLFWPKALFGADRLAQRHELPYLSVSSINSREAQRFARRHGPDLLVSAKCPQRIRSAMLAVAARGAINVHASLLPRNAGRTPQVWALAQGDRETGTTVHHMTQEFDAGKVLTRRTLRVEERTNAFELLRRIMVLAGGALVEGVELALAGESGHEQDENGRSYHSHPTREALRALRDNGHRLLSWRDLWRAARDEAERPAQGPARSAA